MTDRVIGKGLPAPLKLPRNGTIVANIAICNWLLSVTFVYTEITSLIINIGGHQPFTVIIKSSNIKEYT